MVLLLVVAVSLRRVWDLIIAGDGDAKFSQPELKSEPSLVLVERNA